MRETMRMVVGACMTAALAVQVLANDLPAGQDPLGDWLAIEDYNEWKAGVDEGCRHWITAPGWTLEQRKQKTAVCMGHNDLIDNPGAIVGRQGGETRVVPYCERYPRASGCMGGVTGHQRACAFFRRLIALPVVTSHDREMRAALYKTYRKNGC